jgi:tRNA-2-methylthio-N6-dimethylallyladenosine synthase
MKKLNLFIETYGCQMNSNDTQIVQTLMLENNFGIANSIAEADIILLNTCSVRDNAEEKIKNRLETLYHLLKKRKKKTILGVIGCMAERLQEKLFETNKVVDLIVGPDEYRKLPALANLAFAGEKAIAIDLSRIETYDDIIPFRVDGISTSISIMRGCNNFCSYCVVPYTRGRERSKPFQSIITEVQKLAESGFKEINLLGQNVNSYKFIEEKAAKNEINFPKLLEKIAKAAPEIRIRFLTSHPKDLSDELIEVIAKYDNICNNIHLALQSGSDRILNLMNRKYSAENYFNLTQKIKAKIPDCTISTDIIAGYPSETLEDHNSTLELMRKVRFNNAFMFKYSPRQGTKSFNEIDDIPEKEKIRRLNEIINLQNQISAEENLKEIDKIVEVLIENQSKKKENEWIGRTKTANLVVFADNERKFKIGDLVKVKIKKTTSATLIGENFE